ncbi:hypothetical protein [Flavobacterium sp. C4GT6]|uniref:hypothetical protein n=1 Tax=Flavobacterium sp. C4GT6 TaxID=3103818 RepID=UPI002ED5F17B
MKCVILFLVALLAMGCKEEKHPKIEIYLLKHRLAFVDAVPFKETSKYKEIEYDRAKDIFKDAQFDTIREEVVFAGQFEADSVDLQSEPFIDDSDIKAFDLRANKLMLSKKVIKRICNLYPDRNFGEQFVITVNKEPMLTGYFWNTQSAVNCRWYYIECLDNEAFPDNGFDTDIVTLYSGVNSEKVEQYGFTRHKELIAAFEQTHRLVE